MRQLTDDEKAALKRGCIFCHGEDFILGPQALGLSFNIYCAECRAGYNVTHHLLPWQVIAQPREITEEALQQLARPQLMMADVETMLDYVRTQFRGTLGL